MNRKSPAVQFMMQRRIIWSSVVMCVASVITTLKSYRVWPQRKNEALRFSVSVLDVRPSVELGYVRSCSGYVNQYDRVTYIDFFSTLSERTVVVGFQNRPV